jgi:hypothetical protein
MDHIGTDVHKRESQIYILAEEGEIIEHRIRTELSRIAKCLAAFLGHSAPSGSVWPRSAAG